MNKPITTGGEHREYKMCKCAKCGVVEMCTPSNDFYTLPYSDDNLIYCEPCMFALGKTHTASLKITEQGG